MPKIGIWPHAAEAGKITTCFSWEIIGMCVIRVFLEQVIKNGFEVIFFLRAASVFCLSSKYNTLGTSWVLMFWWRFSLCCCVWRSSIQPQGPKSWKVPALLHGKANHLIPLRFQCFSSACSWFPNTLLSQPLYIPFWKSVPPHISMGALWFWIFKWFVVWLLFSLLAFREQLYKPLSLFCHSELQMSEGSRALQKEVCW